MDAALSDPAVLIYFIDPNTDIEPLLAPVCQGYRLTVAESELVRSLIGGASIGEAAEDQNISVGAARWCLEQVFVKTDTRRQADLVRLMLSAILRRGSLARAL